MSLQLFGHPFSSYTMKALIALYENQTPFEFRVVGPDYPQNTANWPVSGQWQGFRCWSMAPPRWSKPARSSSTWRCSIPARCR